jgi:hypothetical protein
VISVSSSISSPSCRRGGSARMRVFGGIAFVAQRPLPFPEMSLISKSELEVWVSLSPSNLVVAING